MKNKTRLAFIFVYGLVTCNQVWALQCKKLFMSGVSPELIIKISFNSNKVTEEFINNDLKKAVVSLRDNDIFSLQKLNINKSLEYLSQDLGQYFNYRATQRFMNLLKTGSPIVSQYILSRITSLEYLNDQKNSDLKFVLRLNQRIVKGSEEFSTLYQIEYTDYYNLKQKAYFENQRSGDGRRPVLPLNQQTVEMALEYLKEHNYDPANVNNLFVVELLKSFPNATSNLEISRALNKFYKQTP